MLLSCGRRVQIVDGKKMQHALTGFLGKKTPEFMQSLWTLLLSAQSNPLRVPTALLEEKKAEMKAREQAEAAKRRDAEIQQQRLDAIRDRERGERGQGPPMRGRGGYGGPPQGRGGYDRGFDDRREQGGPRQFNGDRGGYDDRRGGFGGGRGGYRGGRGGGQGYDDRRDFNRRDDYVSIAACRLIRSSIDRVVCLDLGSLRCSAADVPILVRDLAPGPDPGRLHFVA